MICVHGDLPLVAVFRHGGNLEVVVVVESRVLSESARARLRRVEGVRVVDFGHLNQSVE